MRIVRTFEPFLEPTIQGMNHQERAIFATRAAESLLWPTCPPKEGRKQIAESHAGCQLARFSDHSAATVY